MPRKVFFTIGVLVVAWSVRAAATAEELPPPARWLPRDTVAVLEVSEPKAILDLLLDSKLTETIINHPLYKHAMAQPNLQQTQTIVHYVAGELGTDWKTGVRKLAGGGAAIAITSTGAVLLMIDAEDGQMLEKLHGMIVNFAKGDAERQGQPERVKSVKHGGVTCWELGDGRVQAVVGHRYISSNRLDALKAALDLRTAPEQRSLASLSSYQAAKKAVGRTAVASAFVSLAVIKQIPGVKQALTKNTNPLGALLFAGLIDSLRQSNWMALGLKIEDLKLTLEANVDGKPTGQSELAAFARPAKPDQGTLPNLSVPRMIAAMSLYRDLHGFYAAKDKLFPERTSGLIFFENMMGIFFSGRDLTDDVLSEARPEIRLVVAEQKYDPEIGTPHTQIPAFALVLKVLHPKEAGELMEEAFQKAIGLVSFTSGQKGVPGLIVDRPTYSDVRYTVAYSGKIRGEEKGPLAMRYNFRPALVKLADSVVISSTDGLARDLIDALKKETSSPAKPMHEVDSLVDVNATQVASILSANREALIRQNRLEKGTSPKEAEANIGILTQAVKLLGKASLRVIHREEGLQARLELTLNP